MNNCHFPHTFDGMDLSILRLPMSKVVSAHIHLIKEKKKNLIGFAECFSFNLCSIPEHELKMMCFCVKTLVCWGRVCETGSLRVNV